MQQVQSTTLRNTSAASSTTILNLSGVELSTMDFDDNTLFLLAVAVELQPMKQQTSLNTWSLVQFNNLRLEYQIL